MHFFLYSKNSEWAPTMGQTLPRSELFKGERAHKGPGSCLNAGMDAVGVIWSLRFYLSNEITGDANTAGLRAAF